MTNHFRGASRARVLLATTPFKLRHCEERQRRSNPERHRPLDCFACARNDQKQKKESGTPADVFSNLRTFSGAARAKSWRARLSAFHRGSCCSERTPQLSFRYATSWDVAGRAIPKLRTTGSERPCAWQRVIRKDRDHASQQALPAPTCPSPARTLADRSSCRTGACPEAAPVRIANPRGSTALAPCSGVPREHDPLSERDSMAFVPD